MDERPKCVHCKWRIACRGRGLCFSCHKDVAIREQYPLKCRRSFKGEPTEEQLEACIAEQMERLPKWWTQDCRVHNLFRGGFAPRFTARVRATQRRER